MTTNKKAFEALQTAFRELNEIIADAPTNAMAARARKARNAVREEILEMIQRNLTQSGAPYAVLNGPDFRDQVRDLKKLKEEIDELVQATGRFAKVLNWLTALIPLI